MQRAQDQGSMTLASGQGHYVMEGNEDDMGEVEVLDASDNSGSVKLFAVALIVVIFAIIVGCACSSGSAVNAEGTAGFMSKTEGSDAVEESESTDLEPRDNDCCPEDFLGMSWPVVGTIGGLIGATVTLIVSLTCCVYCQKNKMCCYREDPAGGGIVCCAWCSRCCGQEKEE